MPPKDPAGSGQRLPSFRNREDPGNAGEAGLHHDGGLRAWLPKTVAGAGGAQSIRKEPEGDGEGKAGHHLSGAPQ